MTVTRTLTTVVVTLALSGIANAQTPPEATRETWKAGEEATALNSMSVINLRTGYCGGDMTEGSQNRKNIKFIGCVMYVLGVVDMLREWQKLDPTHALPVCVPRSVEADRLIVVVHDYIEATAPWRQQQLDATTSVIGALKATWPCPGR